MEHGHLCHNNRSSANAAGHVCGELPGQEYLNNRYGRFLRSIIFIPTLVSYVAAATVWEIIYADKGGLLNEFLGLFGIQGMNWLGDPSTALICVSLVAVWKSVGYFTIIFYAGIMNISVDVREASIIDGATPRQEVLAHNRTAAQAHHVHERDAGHHLVLPGL